MQKADAQVESNRAGSARKGLVILYTGEGKGKTTAALGLVLRAWGHGMRCCVIQFIKSERGRWGETQAAEKMGIAWHALGSGFTWQSQDLAQDRRKAEEGWALAQREIASGAYDLVVLDEFTYPLRFGWLDAEAVTAWLREHKPPELHLVITGRDAVDALVELADLITEMAEIKHPFAQGVPAQRGIEY